MTLNGATANKMVRFCQPVQTVGGYFTKFDGENVNSAGFASSELFRQMSSSFRVLGRLFLGCLRETLG